jgi:hypothetical protein
MSSPTSASRSFGKAFPKSMTRFMANLWIAFKPRRRMTTAERRELARQAAKDPNVELALQELLATCPEFRMRDTRQRGLRR